jgi:hypothetical protein
VGTGSWRGQEAGGGRKLAGARSWWWQEACGDQESGGAWKLAVPGSFRSQQGWRPAMWGASKLAERHSGWGSELIGEASWLVQTVCKRSELAGPATWRAQRADGPSELVGQASCRARASWQSQQGGWPSKVGWPGEVVGLARWGPRKLGCQQCGGQKGAGLASCWSGKVRVQQGGFQQ